MQQTAPTTSPSEFGLTCPSGMLPAAGTCCRVGAAHADPVSATDGLHAGAGHGCGAAGHDWGGAGHDRGGAGHDCGAAGHDHGGARPARAHACGCEG